METAVLLSGLVTALSGAAVWLVKDKVSKIEGETKKALDEIREIKDNYLDRFDKVNTNINKSKIEILERFHNLELHLKNGK